MIRKYFNIIHSTNRSNKKDYTVISVNTEETDKIQNPLLDVDKKK
jgi:uncharacterized protein YlbG (UPF0298 family)